MIDNIKYETIYKPGIGSELIIHSKTPPVNIKISTKYLLKIENIYKNDW